MLFGRVPDVGWLRPAIGGALLGGLALFTAWLWPPTTAVPGGVPSLLGGGYDLIDASLRADAGIGAALALAFAVLAFLKSVAMASTVGSGASAGDFAPTLAVGAAVGAAFAGVCHVIFPAIAVDAPAAALVGMGVFYGTVAHVPLAAIIMTSELAGNYELLVPLMLTQGVALLLVRRPSLYAEQARSPSATPLSGALGSVSPQGESLPPPF